ncbi:MAG: hypothetical protein BWX86_02517 [Verrucomicrobia bacterium ADurb.Bin122]|nr:MAG: hypothetical protein BWX86_02517 [Verrucomicrobia bacterium ADurb.Bin122]
MRAGSGSSDAIPAIHQRAGDAIWHSIKAWRQVSEVNRSMHSSIPGSISSGATSAESSTKPVASCMATTAAGNVSAPAAAAFMSRRIASF